MMKIEKQTAEKIISEIDEIINKCLHSKPVQFNESQFKKLFEKIDESMESLSWMRNNMIVQGWNIGKKFRKKHKRRCF